MSIPRLFENKNQCSACGACENICPCNAISMALDVHGYLYPQINAQKCVQCRRCVEACNYQNGYVEYEPVTVYAGTARLQNVRRNSASGGIFAVLARNVLQAGGVVFGCAENYMDGKLHYSHTMVDNLENLIRLQGSKYVKSEIGFTYRKVREQLLANRLVLFSGTPCQVDGLLGFLGSQKYDKLFTVDIICHGVPSEKMFQDYIVMEEKNQRCRIESFSFRSKKKGWGSFFFAEHRYDEYGKKKVVTRFARRSSYYGLFLRGILYRENCYSCKYAQRKRVSDITLGDYWGIEKSHPDYLQQLGEDEVRQGISCILVNTINGRKLLDWCKQDINLKESSFASAARENGQLNHPTQRSAHREAVLELYRMEGYDAIDRWYQNRLGIRRYLYVLWDLLPGAWVHRIKKTVKLLKS